jgi:hypothetical protein
MSTIV